MIKTRIFPEHNYKGIYINGKTIRIALDPKKPIDELLYPEFYDVSVTPYCEGNCPYCFLPNTKINTPSGFKKIEDLKKGDLVYSYNFYGSKIIKNILDQIHTRYINEEIIELELENGIIINVTENHEFYTNRGWIEAKNLLDTDILYMK